MLKVRIGHENRFKDGLLAAVMQKEKQHEKWRLTNESKRGNCISLDDANDTQLKIEFHDALIGNQPITDLLIQL
jgi:hypothetical protein